MRKSRSLRSTSCNWRSSKWFVYAIVVIALFAVPILGYMTTERMHIDPSRVQQLTSTTLALHGFVSVVSGPIIGHFADKIESRKTPLLFSLCGCITGTLMVASTHSIWIMLIGRVMQGIAESVVWIVGLATITDVVDDSQTGMAMGMLMSFVNAGMLAGPLVSGFLLEAIGYRAMWAVPLSIITIDLVARLVMVEPPSKYKPEDSVEDIDLNLPQSQPLASNFYKVMLHDSRVITILLVGTASTTVSTSFHATLPIYVHETFRWGPSTTGMLFACLVLPILFMGPIAGRITDRVGVQVPASTSLVLQAGLLGLVGFVGNDNFPWASTQDGGKAIYIGSLIAIGALRPFMSAIGPVELSAWQLVITNIAAIVKEYQDRSPGIFGPQGGISRVFSMVEVSACLGMMLGPIIGGVLKRLVGYTCMNLSF
ncbi:Tetracycline resistance protein TetA/multidrug resistance protein MdtG, partial [Penicillium tannophilum]